MNAAAILALIRLIQDLTPEAAAAIRDLFDKLGGMTAEQLVALTHSINAATVTAIDAELSRQVPPTTTIP